MRILLISPLGFAVNAKSRYVGIEQLVWNYACELIKEHDVFVWGHADSVFPDKVVNMPSKPSSSGDTYLLSELGQFQTHQSITREVDVIHDFSHQHFTSRFMPNMPTLNIFWHAPRLAKYPKALYNIIALSQWAARDFERVYRQKARYQQSIALDTTKYKLSSRHRNNRFMALARSGEEKGNLNAAMVCKKFNLELDILSAPGTEAKAGEVTEYDRQVMALCDRKRIKFYPNSLPEPEKIKMMQTNKALLYITNHPEVTSHKIQECLLCGMPVIVPGIGALPEIVTQGVDGFLCRSEAEFIMAIDNVDKLTPLKTHEQTVDKYSISSVVKGYMPLYEEVANGLRWK